MRRRVGNGETVALDNKAQLRPVLPSEAHVRACPWAFSTAGLRTRRLFPTGSSFPIPGGSVLSSSVRSCLPLRGSSGFTPDSLFSLTERGQATARETTIYWDEIPSTPINGGRSAKDIGWVRPPNQPRRKRRAPPPWLPNSAGRVKAYLSEASWCSGNEC
jgi:hypothetical protein